MQHLKYKVHVASPPTKPQWPASGQHQMEYGMSKISWKSTTSTAGSHERSKQHQIEKRQQRIRTYYYRQRHSIFQLVYVAQPDWATSSHTTEKQKKTMTTLNITIFYFNLANRDSTKRPNHERNNIQATSFNVWKDEPKWWNCIYTQQFQG